MKFRFSPFIFVFLSLRVAFSFDPSAVKWNEVSSEVRWLNLYSEPTFLTLSIDEFDALKRLKPGGIYTSTKFPPGEFKAGIKDGRTSRNIEQFAFSVENGMRYLVVTFGDDKTGIRSLTIKENQKLEGERSRLRLFNGCPDSSVHWKTQDGKSESNEFGMSAEYKFDASSDFSTACEILFNEKKVNVPILIPQMEKGSWLCFIHFDGIDPSIVRLTVLRENSNYYRGPEE